VNARAAVPDRPTSYSKRLGVTELFTPGVSTDEIVEFVRERCRRAALND
jgi:methylmalonyl-CoA mutase cobalamin-binding subunit